MVKTSVSNAEFGEPKERAAIPQLEEVQQKTILAKPGVGEFDGDEFGTGSARL